MLKLIILLIVTVLLLQLMCLYSQENYTLRKLNGGYKICSLYTYEYKSGVIDSTSRVLDVITFYDNKGKIIERKNCNIYKKTSFYKTTFKYNENGDPIEYILYKNTYKDTAVSIRSYYKYNDSRRLKEIEDYDSNGDLNKKFIYEYNEAGIQIEKQEVDKDGSLRYKFLYKYDAKRNLTDVIQYHSSGSFYEQKSYKYDDENYLVEIDFKYENGKIFIKIEFQNDVWGNPITEIWYDENDEPTQKKEYIYSK
jgi:hypothetical protein